MKATLHFKTGDFEFIETEVEGEPEAVIETYRTFHKLYNGGEGLPTKEYNAFIERQLMEQPNQMEEYIQMSDEQKGTVQTIKRALLRLKSREEHE